MEDYADADDDNDGVLDTADAFPFDETENKDNDNDGIGDNKDKDDDNDGIEDSLDFMPNNSACYKKNSGDGTICYMDLLKESSIGYDDITTFINDDTYIFILKDTKKIIFFDSIKEEFLKKIDLKINGRIRTIEYLKDQNILYLSEHSSTRLVKVNLDDGKEVDIVNHKYYFDKFKIIGDYILIYDDHSHYIYKKDGTLVKKNDIDYSDSIVWNSSLSRLYYFESRSILSYRNVDITTGLLGNRIVINTPSSVDSTLTFKSKEKNIMSDGRNLFNMDTQKWIGSLDEEASLLYWSENNEMAYTSNKTNSSLLKVFNDNLSLLGLKNLI
jgi:hypothetical protein